MKTPLCRYLIRVDDLTLDRLAGPVVVQHLAQIGRLQQLHPLRGFVVILLQRMETTLSSVSKGCGYHRVRVGGKAGGGGGFSAKPSVLAWAPRSHTLRWDQH